MTRIRAVHRITVETQPFPISDKNINCLNIRLHFHDKQ